MLHAIIIVIKCLPRVVRRINEHALDVAGEFLFESFQGEEIVAEDEAVVEEVGFPDTMRRVVRFLGILQQDAGFKPGTVFLADPSQFKARIVLGHGLNPAGRMAPSWGYYSSSARSKTSRWLPPAPAESLPRTQGFPHDGKHADYWVFEDVGGPLGAETARVERGPKSGRIDSAAGGLSAGAGLRRGWRWAGAGAARRAAGAAGAARSCRRRARRPPTSWPGCRRCRIRWRPQPRTLR